jgi:hypothetical protein
VQVIPLERLLSQHRETYTHTQSERALCRTVSIQLSKVLYSLSTLSSQKRVIKLHYLTFYCARAPKQKQKGINIGLKKVCHSGRPHTVEPPAESRCDLNVVARCESVVASCVTLIAQRTGSLKLKTLFNIFDSRRIAIADKEIKASKITGLLKYHDAEEAD